MPNAELPQFQYPDIIGAYLRGRAAPGQQQLQQQQIQAGQMNMDQLRQAMQTTQMRQANAQQFLGERGGQAQTASYDLPPGSPVAQNGEDMLTALGSDRRVASMVRHDQVEAALKGESVLDPVKKGYEVQAAAMKDQQERKKFALQPVVDQIESVRTAANPEQLVMANASYKQVWDQYAPQLGLNPHDPKDLTADNVRAAATLAHNNIASQSMGGITPMEMPTTFSREKGPGGSVLQVEHGGKESGKASELVGRAPVSVLAGNAPTIAGTDPRIQSWVRQVHDGNATMQQVPMALRTSVAEAMGSDGKDQYSPQASSRLTLAASRITHQFTNMSAYKLTADGKPYLERIQAALATPGSVSDQDLLDSLTKLNTGGNAVTDAQVKLITDGKSFADMANTFGNKFKNGGVLSPNQRQQISTIANAIYDNYKKGYQPIYEQAAKQLTDANIPKAFWTIPDLNSINATAPAGGGHPQDIQDLLKKYGGK